MIKKSAVERGTLSEYIKTLEDRKAYEKQVRINERAKKPLTEEAVKKLRAKAPRINPRISNLFEKKASAYTLA